MKNAGFTLIELLVVISIIGVLAGLLLTNFVGIRGRAADVKRKSDLQQLQKALRLYYNDFQSYPSASNDLVAGCGADGDAECSGSFSTASETYMSELPVGYTYYSDGDESFLLRAVLENVSDEDIASSQTKCDPEGRSYYGIAPENNEYFICEN